MYTYSYNVAISHAARAPCGPSKPGARHPVYVYVYVYVYV